jgi:hypothetical protein
VPMGNDLRTRIVLCQSSPGPGGPWLVTQLASTARGSDVRGLDSSRHRIVAMSDPLSRDGFRLSQPSWPTSRPVALQHRATPIITTQRRRHQFMHALLAERLEGPEPRGIADRTWITLCCIITRIVSGPAANAHAEQTLLARRMNQPSARNQHIRRCLRAPAAGMWTWRPAMGRSRL